MKLAVDLHHGPLKANKDQRSHEHEQQSRQEMNHNLNPMMQMASTIGNQNVIQMMRGHAMKGGKSSLGSAGERLPENVQEKMEQSFQTDFSSVQIYKDSSVAASMGAQAFAQGEQVHFAPGQFSPDSHEGQKLLGHELAHVVQQREGQVEHAQGKGFAVNMNENLEQKADAAGERAARGQAASLEHRSENASASSATANAAPIQASFFKSVLGGLKKAGQSFMESGGMETLMNVGKSAGQALMGGGSFTDVLKAGGSSFIQSGGVGQLGGAAFGGASSFAQDSGLASAASPYLQKAQPLLQHVPGLAQKAVDSGAVDMAGSKMSGFGSSMEGEGGFKGLLGKGLNLAGSLLGSFGKKKKG